MGDEGLRLNELDRFRKRRSRLALEVHSHCEVPAGCGGVVLRWRRPGAAIGVRLSHYVAGEAGAFFVDGTPVDEQRVRLAPGDHVISFEVRHPGPGGFLLWTMSLDPSIATAANPALRSAADGRWTASTQDPPEGWQLPAFDGGGFVALLEQEVPRPEARRALTWDCLREEARGLGLPTEAVSGPRAWFRARGTPTPERIWVRCRFHLDDGGFT